MSTTYTAVARTLAGRQFTERISQILGTLPAHVSLDQDEQRADIALDDDGPVRDVVALFVDAGMPADHAPRQRRLWVRAEPVFAPCGPVGPATVTADRKVLALCVHLLTQDWREKGSIWRHVLECQDVTGAAQFANVSTGGCDTCAYTFPAVRWWATCACGLISFGNAKNPVDHPLTDNQQQLPWLLQALDDLATQYLQDPQPYPCWLPGISRLPRAKTGTSRP